jgi:hypothetical protein
MRARGRIKASRGLGVVKLTNASPLALLAAVLLAGCGGIDSADGVLSTGQVTGQLLNAKPGAYVYPLGAPERKVSVNADGSFQVERVPLGAGQAQLVVYDGGDIGVGKAELVAVEVQPAKRTRAPDKDAAQMPLAGSIAVAVNCTGNQKPDKARYTVDGTEFEDHDGGARVTLYPLPPGKYTVRASLPGLKQKGPPKEVVVAPGASAVGEIDMDSDDGDARKGCLSTACPGSLQCDDSDGRCYECTSRNGSTVGCAAGVQCKDHVCGGSGGANDGRSACLPCTVDAECAPTGSGRCIPAADGSGTVCSRACASDVDCPSGFGCGLMSDGSKACIAAPSCASVVAVFGIPCVDDNAIDCPGLADATCFGLVKQHSQVITSGYCTSRCLVNADCPTSRGFSCNGGVCTR